MLEAVIEKAIENGYETDWLRDGELTKDELYGTLDQLHGLFDVLFSHDFAKKYFGDRTIVTGKEEYECIDCGKCEECDSGHIDTKNVTGTAWRHHLTQAVLSEDPLLYYYQHL